MVVPVEVFAEIDSTNAEARRRAESGEVGPVWITAARQTAGRGRRGRAWSTQEGNLAATLLTVTDRPPGEAAQIAFVAALAVADLACAYIAASLVGLKWPNDLLVGGRKAAGILIESGAATATGGLWLAVGIGINLAHAPEATNPAATALAGHMSGPPPGPLEALNVLALAFERWRAVWDEVGFAPIHTAWSGRAHGLGERCLARLPDGEIEGVAEALEADGALRLRLADGTLRRITAGDVFFC